MPYYDCYCPSCKHKEIDLFKGYNDKYPKCPICKKTRLEKDYSTQQALPGFHVKEIKTVAQQVEANKKVLGNEQWQKKKDELLGEHGKKQQEAEKPFYWDKDQSKPLDVTKIKDTAKFIQTGEKN